MTTKLRVPHISLILREMWAPGVFGRDSLKLFGDRLCLGEE
jgi:hypothetical protein